MAVDRPLYSHRQRASLPRTVENFEEPAWISIKEVVRQCLNANYLAQTCPEYCNECLSVIGTDRDSFFSLMTREIPRIDHRKFEVPGPLPGTCDVLDMIELVFRCTAMPATKYNENCYVECDSLEFSNAEGRDTFRGLINKVLDRERIAFELTESGLITRVGAPILSDVVSETRFQTGDKQLDDMLGTAQDKFVSRDPTMHREALSELWRAWERLKTLEPGRDKKASTSALLDSVADGPVRDRLECEARELTRIGNNFTIRHSEVDKHTLENDRHVDYLFHRMFSMVYLLLDATGRVVQDGSDG